MKGFWAIAVKEFLHIKRDPAIIFFALLVPCVQMIILGFAFDFDVRHLKTAVVDHSQSRESRVLIHKLENTQYVKACRFTSSEDEASDLIKEGLVKAALIIPPDFADNPKAMVLLDGSDSQTSAKAAAAMSGLGSSMKAAGIGTLQTGTADAVPYISVRILYNPGGETRLYTIPGLIGVVLQLCTVVLTALSLVKEKEQGTMEQLMVTPVSPMGLMLGKLAPYAVMAMAEMHIVLYFAWLLFNISIQGSLLSLILMTVPFVLATLALGLLVSTAAQNQSQALQMVVALLIPSILLSGFIFPIDSLPVPLYIFSQMFPITPYMEILRAVIIRGAGMEQLQVQHLTLWIMAAVLLAAAAARFSKSVS